MVDALDDGLSGRRGLDETLKEYERRRNEVTMADYRLNLERARFTPLPAEQARLRDALRGNPADTNHYYRAVEGMVPPDTFFNPENLQRIVAQGATGRVSRG